MSTRPEFTPSELILNLTAKGLPKLAAQTRLPVASQKSNPDHLEQPTQRIASKDTDNRKDRADRERIRHPGRQSKPWKDDYLGQYGDTVTDQHVDDRLYQRYQTGLLQDFFALSSDAQPRWV
jgi:hypothetical protein